MADMISKLESPLLRLAAAMTTAGTLLFLFVGDDWRWSNPFLIPDLIVCIALTVGALASGRTVRPKLFLGFGIGVGVFSVANASYLVTGRFGVGAAIAWLTCAVSAAWLYRASLTAIR